MSNASDFIIENGVLIKYVGPGGDIVVPDGVREISTRAFDICNGLNKVVLPEGVTKIAFHAFNRCESLTEVFFPASIKEINADTFGFCPKLSRVEVDEKNELFRSLDGVLFDASLSKLLIYPAGKGNEYRIPDGVKYADLDGFVSFFHKEVLLRIPASVESICLIDGGKYMTIYAPSGSYAERFAKRNGCGFVEEGEPVAADDSYERVERSLKDWRLIFTISTRSKGLNISKYSRSSKIVYLPDKMGNSEVASIDKAAFPENTVVLCSKKLFAKLSQENKDATIRAYLLDSGLFTEEEQGYLLEYLKKNRSRYLEKQIVSEDYPALRKCLELLSSVKTLIEECLDITARCGKTSMNLFLLNFKNETANKPDVKKEKAAPKEKKALAADAMPFAEGKKLFKLSVNDKGITISGYKGKDSELIIPDNIGEHSVVEIKARAFAGMDAITKVSIPDTVMKIGAEAFNNCGNLESVVLPSKLAAIEKYTFHRCPKLNTINIPDTVKKIGESAFSGCAGLADEKGFVIIKNCLYGYYGASNVVSIPDGVKEIESFAFGDQADITEINLPESLKKIGYRAFQGCIGLTTIDLPAGLTGIGGGAFDQCRKLKEIAIPSRVKKLEGFTFAGCKDLEIVHIGSELAAMNTIGEPDFLMCKKLSIHAPAGSYAEQYAKENNIPFVAE